MTKIKPFVPSVGEDDFDLVGKVSLRMFDYVKTAFMNRWNLLFFGGGLVFAGMSGRFDVVGSLVIAAEIAYLGFLGTHPKFQKYVKAQRANPARQKNQQDAYQLTRRILAELPKKDVDQFNELRDRCENLRKLARQMQVPTGEIAPSEKLEEFQIAGLDRLLWMHLKMLFTRYAVARFLAQTQVAGIERDIAESTDKLAELQDRPDDPMLQRRKKLLEDNLETSRTRLANYHRSQANQELMDLEIKRLENTIHSLSELSVTRAEPKSLSDQIDRAADSMVQTERAMGDLHFATGLELDDDQVPQLLRSDVEFE